MKLKNALNPDAWDIRINRLFRNRNIKGFYKTLFYDGTWNKTTWLGVPVWKMPLDMWVYQEMICEFKPDYIIECGTYKGGSAFYFASICELINNGHIITIDVNPCEMEHPRVTKIVHDKDGGSTAPIVVEKVKKMVGTGKCMVILDSLHRTYHVEKELELYSQFVPVGSYIIVEDTCVAGNPVVPSWKNEFKDGGPMQAVENFIEKCNGDFVIDRSREKFLISWFPKGYLKRVK